MKYLFFILLFITIISKSYTRCGTRIDFNIKPASFLNIEVKNNNIFILEVGDYYYELISYLNKTKAIYLQSGKHKVNLNILDTCESTTHTKQAILEVSEKLHPNKVYLFKIDNARKYYNIISKQVHLSNLKYKAFIKDFNIRSTYKFKLTKINDTIKPNFRDIPKEINKHFRQLGCGDENYVDFSFNVIDSSKVIVETIVKSKSSKIERKYYLVPKNDQLRVGREMCGGPFEFDDGGDEYEVKFNLIDVFGNRTDWVGEPISFTRPLKEYLKAKSNK